MSFIGLQISLKSASLITFLGYSSDFIPAKHLALPLCVKRATQIKLPRLTGSAAVHKFPPNHSSELQVETEALLRLAAPREAGWFGDSCRLWRRCALIHLFIYYYHFTFAGLAVGLQSEADGATAADSRHRVVTRAVTAAIVHGAGLCGKNRHLSETRPTESAQRLSPRPIYSSPANSTHA